MTIRIKIKTFYIQKIYGFERDIGIICPSAKLNLLHRSCQDNIISTLYEFESSNAIDFYNAGKLQERINMSDEIGNKKIVYLSKI